MKHTYGTTVEVINRVKKSNKRGYSHTLFRIPKELYIEGYDIAKDYNYFVINRPDMSYGKYFFTQILILHHGFQVFSLDSMCHFKREDIIYVTDKKDENIEI